MRARWLAVGWVCVAGAVWSGFYDLLISRGAKDYLLREAQARLGDGPPASMPAIMAQTQHDAAITASVWAALIVLAGWASIWLARHRS